MVLGDNSTKNIYYKIKTDEIVKHIQQAANIVAKCLELPELTSIIFFLLHEFLKFLQKIWKKPCG